LLVTDIGEKRKQAPGRVAAKQVSFFKNSTVALAVGTTSYIEGD
jgi:hypothetical protein